MFTTGSRDFGIGYSSGVGPSGIIHRLYDLENDPQESTDVSEKYPEVLKQMQQEMLPRLWKHTMMQINVPKVWPLKEKSSGFVNRGMWKPTSR